MSNALELVADRLEHSEVDPRLAWRRAARPDQLEPPANWRPWLVRGGRGAGKTKTGSSTLADWILSDPEPGEWGICAPTYRDAWTVCVAGEAGILAALGTSEAEIKNHTSRVVAYEQGRK